MPQTIKLLLKIHNEQEVFLPVVPLECVTADSCLQAIYNETEKLRLAFFQSFD